MMTTAGQGESVEGDRFAVAADRVFDGGQVLAEHAVVIDGAEVAEVVPRRSVAPSVPVLYEPDTTILPGLIDTHVHLMRWESPLFLAYGVTTVRDTGNDLGWILGQRHDTKGSAAPGILCAGPLIDGPKPGHKLLSRACCDADDAVAAVRETVAAGVDGIKLYHNLPLAWLADMVREAHGAGLKVSMHCVQTGVVGPGRAGVDEFFHLDGILTDVWPDHPPGWLEVWGLPGFADTLEAQRRVADTIAELGMTATPTLSYWESRWRIRAADYQPDSEARHVPQAMRRWQGTAETDPAAAEQCRRALHAAQRFTQLLLDRNVRVLAGTDVPFGAITPGRSLWREMSLLVEAGMSVQGALRSATSDAAAFLGRPLLGQLSPGLVADLAVVRGDPTRSIPAEPEMVAIVHDGTVHRQTELLLQAAEAARTVKDDPWSVQLRAHCSAHRRSDDGTAAHRSPG